MTQFSNTRKTLATVLAGAALAGAFGAVATVAPVDSKVGELTAQSAQAGTWIPQYPSTKQPVGWGSVCAKVKNYSNGRYQSTTEYRWFTTSLGKSTCQPYRTYR